MPDYDEKTEQFISRLERAQVQLPEHVANELMTSEQGPQLLYLMAGDDGFAATLLNSDPVSAAREIGRREALLSQHKPNKTKSTAPDPVKPLKGGSDTVKDPEAMSYTDYRKWRGFDK